MMTGKIAVSLPQAQIAAAKRAVREGRARSVSAYVSEAVALREQEETLAALVDEWVAEDGPPSPADYAWADGVLAPRTAQPAHPAVGPGRAEG